MSENKKLTPKIRFKGFTEDWEQRKFGDYGTVSMCKRIFKNETSDSGDIPFYKIGTFGGKADAFISNEKYDYYKSKFSYPNKGDILLSASGTIGRIVEYTGEKAYFQDSNIVWLNHNEDIKNVFLKVLYPTVKWDGIEGSTIKRLYNSNFLNTCINIPNTLEQDKIGELFANLDNLITLHQRKYDKLVKIKSSLLEKMFPKNSSKIPEVRFKGFTEDWEQRKLNEFTRYISSNLSISDSINNGKYNLYDANNIIGKVNCKNISEEFITIIKDGSGVGKVRRLPKNSCFIGTMGGILSKESNIDFVYCCLLNTDFTKEINGATIPHIYYSNYGNNEYYVPKYLEQEKIGDLFTNLDNLITLHQRKHEKLVNLKQSLLNDMFI